MRRCNKCGRDTATHSIFSTKEGTERHLCCICNIEEGYPAADWHPACMKALAEQKERTDGTNVR